MGKYKKLAGEQRKKQEIQNPPIKKKRQHGGARKMAGRKKSKPKV